MGGKNGEIHSGVVWGLTNERLGSVCKKRLRFDFKNKGKSSVVLSELWALCRIADKRRRIEAERCFLLNSIVV
jgi:hypothetical protein